MEKDMTYEDWIMRSYHDAKMNLYNHFRYNTFRCAVEEVRDLAEMWWCVDDDLNTLYCAEHKGSLKEEDADTSWDLVTTSQGKARYDSPGKLCLFSCHSDSCGGTELVILNKDKEMQVQPRQKQTAQPPN